MSINVGKNYVYKSFDLSDESRNICLMLSELTCGQICNHPNIYKPISTIFDNNICKITMQKYLPLKYIDTFYLIQLLDALAYLESIEYVHGDISLENIMLYKDINNILKPIIIDFDSSFFGTYIGNTHKKMYMAPETKLYGFTDSKSDVYALCCAVLFSRSNTLYNKAYNINNIYNRFDYENIINKQPDAEILREMFKDYDSRPTATKLLQIINNKKIILDNIAPIHINNILVNHNNLNSIDLDEDLDEDIINNNDSDDDNIIFDSLDSISSEKYSKTFNNNYITKQISNSLYISIYDDDFYINFIPNNNKINIILSSEKNNSIYNEIFDFISRDRHKKYLNDKIYNNIIYLYNMISNQKILLIDKYYPFILCISIYNFNTNYFNEYFDNLLNLYQYNDIIKYIMDICMICNYNIIGY